MKLKTLALAAVATLSFSASAHARVINNVFGGFANGVDTLGYFGPAGGVFTNTPFLWIQTIDTTKVLTLASPGTVDVREGGQTALGPNGGILSTLRVGGAQITIGDSQIGEYALQDSSVTQSGSIIDALNFDRYLNQTVSGVFYDRVEVSILEEVVSDHNDLLQGLDYLQPVRRNAPGVYTGYLGYYQTANYYTDGVLLVDVWQGQNETEEFIDLTPRFFGAGVPEPAAWLSMLLGVGGLGAVMRRRRAVVPA